MWHDRLKDLLDKQNRRELGMDWKQGDPREDDHEREDEGNPLRTCNLTFSR